MRDLNEKGYPFQGNVQQQTNIRVIFSKYYLYTIMSAISNFSNLQQQQNKMKVTDLLNNHLRDIEHFCNVSVCRNLALVNILENKLLDLADEFSYERNISIGSSIVQRHHKKFLSVDFSFSRVDCI